MNKTVLMMMLLSATSVWAVNPADLTCFYTTASNRSFYKVTYDGNGTRALFGGVTVGESAAMSVFSLQNKNGNYKLTELKLARSLTPDLDITINSDIVGGGKVSNNLGVDARFEKFGMGIIIPMKVEDTANILMGSRFTYGILTGYLTATAHGKNFVYGLTAKKGGMAVDLAHQPNGNVSWLRLSKVIGLQSGLIIPEIRIQTTPGCGDRYLGFGLGFVPKK